MTIEQAEDTATKHASVPDILAHLFASFYSPSVQGILAKGIAQSLKEIEKETSKEKELEANQPTLSSSRAALGGISLGATQIDHTRL